MKEPSLENRVKENKSCDDDSLYLAVPIGGDNHYENELYNR